MAHTHIHEWSQKGANQPESTHERNGTHTQECSRRRGMAYTHTHTRKNEWHTHTYMNALRRAQTTQIAHQRGMTQKHTQKCSWRRGMTHTQTHTQHTHTHTHARMLMEE